MSNRITTDYVAKCVDGGSGLRAATRELHIPETYAKSYGHLLLDRPLFAEEGEINDFAADLAIVFDTLVALPDQHYGGDLRRYCAAIGMDPALARLMCLGATGRPPLHARADAYHDGTGFKLLELNVGSELGGTDSAQLNRAYLGVPAFADYAAQHGLGHLDTTARVAEALRRVAAPVTGGREPAVALIESSGGLAAHEHVFLALQEAMRRHGIELALGEIHQVGEAGGKLTLRGDPVDVILRYFAAGELAGDARAEEALERIMRAHLDGRTVLFTPLEGALFASKGSLGLLHEPRIRAAMSDLERAVVDRVVPWTRLLVDDPEQSPADRAELLDRCRAERATLVLKPGIGYGGVGTTVGHEVTDESWAEVLERCVGGDYVVQQLVRPAPEPVVNAETGEVAGWNANWGIFVDRDGYAGAFVRALKARDGAVISYSNPGTRGTCVFTSPARA